MHLKISFEKIAAILCPPWCVDSYDIELFIPDDSSRSA